MTDENFLRICYTDDLVNRPENNFIIELAIHTPFSYKQIEQMYYDTLVILHRHGVHNLTNEQIYLLQSKYATYVEKMAKNGFDLDFMWMVELLFDVTITFEDFLRWIDSIPVRVNK